MASTESLKPMVMLASYGASKSGLVMLTKTMALELARSGILVNAVAPGCIETERTKKERSDRSRALGVPEDKIKHIFLQRMPLGRMGEPDDIAKVVLFLASEGADFITGELIVADGGHLLS